MVCCTLDVVTIVQKCDKDDKLIIITYNRLLAVMKMLLVLIVKEATLSHFARKALKRVMKMKMVIV